MQAQGFDSHTRRCQVALVTSTLYFQDLSRTMQQDLNKTCALRTMISEIHRCREVLPELQESLDLLLCDAGRRLLSLQKAPSGVDGVSMRRRFEHVL